MIIGRLHDARNFWMRWPEELRQDTCAWLSDNGIDPNNVPITAVVEVVLMDTPFIRWTEYVRDENGKLQLHCDCGRDDHCTILTKVKQTLLIEPMPDCLNALIQEF